MYPFNLLAAIPVDAKGATDEYTGNRVTDFIKNTGVKNFVYLSDQEGSLRATFQAAIRQLATDGDIAQAVPEKSAVGERQSNGLAERSVQAFEDLMRCYKLAFDDHLGESLGTKSPLFKWMVEHTASVFNRATECPDGLTPYQRIHGCTSSTRAVEFG